MGEDNPAGSLIFLFPTDFTDTHRYTQIHTDTHRYTQIINLWRPGGFVIRLQKMS